MTDHDGHITPEEGGPAASAAGPGPRGTSADRAARIQAARDAMEARKAAERDAVALSPTIPSSAAAAAAAFGESPPPSSPAAGAHMAAPTPPPVAVATTSPASRPAQRQPAGRASRFALAGGAVGLGFALVGAMAGAASHDAQASTPDPVQRIVVQQPQAASPAAPQVIVMLPQNVDTPVTTIEVPAVTNAVAIPERAAAPAPVVQAPVTESNGS